MQLFYRQLTIRSLAEQFGVIDNANQKMHSSNLDWDVDHPFRVHRFFPEAFQAYSEPRTRS